MADRDHMIAPDLPRIGRRIADALADMPDTRDQLFQPALLPLPPKLLPFEGGTDWWSPDRIRDQGNNPSCVGHALAATIDHMRAAALASTDRKALANTFRGSYVSADMLYNLAQYHDEWSGEDYSGSSIRGGLKGFFYNGVCSEAEYRKRGKPTVKQLGPLRESDWYMTKTLVEEARTIQLGAYYRVRPRIPDVHAALHEAGVLVVSATTHDGWLRPTAAEPEIPYDEHRRYPPGQLAGRHAMHAFTIVGYDEVGLWVQNSWGRSWGRGGLACWRYEDWAANIVDAWVLRLAALPPEGRRPANRTGRLMAYGRKIDRSDTHFLGHAQNDSTGPSRLDVLGHLVPFRDGRLDRHGPYNVDRQTLAETFDLIRSRYADDAIPSGAGRFAGAGVKVRPGDQKYRHVLVYFLGGWPDENRVASDIADIIPTFKHLGIYPFFVSFDTPMFRELNILVRRVIDDVARLSADPPASRRTVRDRQIEGRIALPGNSLLRDLRISARRVFRLDHPDPDLVAKAPSVGEGAHCLARLFEDLMPLYRAGALDFHVAAHGFGAQLLVEAFANQSFMHAHAGFTTCTLVSPLVATHRFGLEGRPVDNDSLYDSVVPRGERIQRRGKLSRMSIERLRLITLGPQALRTDRFSDDYGRSWPELWSYVLGHDPAANEPAGQGVSLMGDAATGESGAGRGRRYVPLLALPHQAASVIEAARQDQLNVTNVEIVSREDDVDSSLHHELGFHRAILDKIVSDILGTDATGTFRGNGREIGFVEVVDSKSANRL